MEGTERQEGESLRLTAPVKGILRALATVIVALSLVSFVGETFTEFVITDNKYLDRIVEWLDVNAEGSVPTWYATITLMACSLLAFVIAVDAMRRRRPYRSHWAAIAVAFALLSLEEILGIHSEATRVLREFVSISDPGPYALALGAIAIFGLALVVLVFGRFYLHLPARWRTWFMVGVVIYAAGVIGTDAVGDYLMSETGGTTLAFMAAVTIEEFLEMTGVLIFIVLLLDYVQTFVGPVSFEVTQPVGP